MTRYLLDTNVVSEIRKTRPHGAVVAWLGSLHGGQVCVSAVTLGELQAGIEMTRAQDATEARILTVWLDEIAQSQEILPMNGPCFREWARLSIANPTPLFRRQ